MTGDYSYDRLTVGHESENKADVNEVLDEPNSTSSPWSSHLARRPLPVYNLDEKPNMISVNSFDTFESSKSSTSSGSNFEKLKNLGQRIRRKPLPRYLRGSVRVHPAAEVEPIRVGGGVWKDQLLIDRSLRGMAALMTLLAVGIIILIALYAKRFRDRSNPNTTSVGGDVRSCKDVTRTNTAMLLLINICATMILGMSNTYQQLVTSIKITDLKHVLSKFGDSRVGTNSPFSINHKQHGKKRSWAAWGFLVLTSMPIHFLGSSPLSTDYSKANMSNAANSLIGPSFIQGLPSQVEFDSGVNMTAIKNGGSYYVGDTLRGSMSFVCWSALRTGKPHFPASTAVLDASRDIYGSDSGGFGKTWSTIRVHYDMNCTDYAQTATDVSALENSWFAEEQTHFKVYREGNCEMGQSVYCSLHDEQPAVCRLNVRMSAAFVLAACLVLKALYMLSVNICARGKLKSHCLTFGDVVVASASDPDLRVQGYVFNHTCSIHC
jgi:hypothetical protein